MAQTICDATGKAVRNVVKGTSHVLALIKNWTTLAGKTIVSTTKAVGHALKGSVPSWGQFCCEDDGRERLAYLENRKKEIIVQLGPGPLADSNLKTSDGLDELKQKELLKEAEKCEKEIQEIKDKLELREINNECAIILRRAKADLKSNEPETRRVAVRILERMATREVIPALTAVLEDPDTEVRELAAKAIHHLVNKKTPD